MKNIITCVAYNRISGLVHRISYYENLRDVFRFVNKYSRKYCIRLAISEICYE